VIAAIAVFRSLNAEQPLFWQIATYLVLSACVLVIVAAAFAFVYSLVYEPLERARAMDRERRRSLDTIARFPHHKEQ